AAADPGARPSAGEGAAAEGRRVVVDQREPEAVVGGPSGDVLSAEVGERGPVPDVQADAVQGPSGGPHGAVGASGGVCVAAVLPIAPGARGVGVAVAAGCESGGGGGGAVQRATG